MVPTPQASNIADCSRAAPLRITRLYCRGFLSCVEGSAFSLAVCGSCSLLSSCFAACPVDGRCDLSVPLSVAAGLSTSRAVPESGLLTPCRGSPPVAAPPGKLPMEPPPLAPVPLSPSGLPDSRSRCVVVMMSSHSKRSNRHCARRIPLRARYCANVGRTRPAPDLAAGIHETSIAHWIHRMVDDTARERRPKRCRALNKRGNLVENGSGGFVRRFACAFGLRHFLELRLGHGLDHRPGRTF